MTDFAAIILAAGLGKRTGSKLPKVLIQTNEKKPLISYVLKTIEEISPSRLSVVVGYQKELVTSYLSSFSGNLPKTEFCVQLSQNGTGDAVKSARSALEDWRDPVLIMCGDMPLVEAQSLKKLLDYHESSKATVSLLTASVAYDNDYGRILRDSSGHPCSILERKDCSSAEIGISERNLGVYCVESAFLFSALDRLENNNSQSEYYLTDIVKIAASEGQTVVAIPCSRNEEALGVNDQNDLLILNEELRKRRISYWARNGVKFLMPDSVFIDESVILNAGVTIGPNVQILGVTEIGQETIIEGTSLIRDSKIGNKCLLRLGSYLTEVKLGNEVAIGPFVQLRPKTDLADNVAIGNFVELKNARLANGVKANHLSYLGDCEIGENSNIGAGTITCNYDGVKKSKTIIGKEVFVGSNSALVAPLTLGDGSVIGAGSVLSKDVAPDSLALTRAPMITKAGWAKHRKNRK